MKYKPKIKSRNAFTIVELVIVIAVIAILAAVLIPTFASVIRKARDARLEAELNAKEKENIIDSILNNEDSTKVGSEKEALMLSHNGFAMQVIRLENEDTDTAYAFKFKYGITEERMSYCREQYNALVRAAEELNGTIGDRQALFYIGHSHSINILTVSMREFVYDSRYYYWPAMQMLNIETGTVTFTKDYLLYVVERSKAQESPANVTDSNQPYPINIAAGLYCGSRVPLLSFDMLFYFNGDYDDPKFTFCTPEVLLEYNRAQGNTD